MSDFAFSTTVPLISNTKYGTKNATQYSRESNGSWSNKRRNDASEKSEINLMLLRDWYDYFTKWLLLKSVYQERNIIYLQVSRTLLRYSYRYGTTPKTRDSPRTIAETLLDFETFTKWLLLTFKVGLPSSASHSTVHKRSEHDILAEMTCTRSILFGTPPREKYKRVLLLSVGAWCTLRVLRAAYDVDRYCTPYAIRQQVWFLVLNRKKGN
jgi:hypothetical protein